MKVLEALFFTAIIGFGLFWAGVFVWMMWWALYETVRAFFGVKDTPEKKYKISQHQRTVRNILAMERELFGNNNEMEMKKWH